MLQYLSRWICSPSAPGFLPSIAQLQLLVVLTLGLHPQGRLLAEVLESSVLSWGCTLPADHRSWDLDCNDLFLPSEGLLSNPWMRQECWIEERLKLANHGLGQATCLYEPQFPFLENPGSGGCEDFSSCWITVMVVLTSESYFSQLRFRGFGLCWFSYS